MPAHAHPHTKNPKKWSSTWENGVYFIYSGRRAIFFFLYYQREALVNFWVGCATFNVGYDLLLILFPDWRISVLLNFLCLIPFLLLRLSFLYFLFVPILSSFLFSFIRAGVCFPFFYVTKGSDLTFIFSHFVNKKKTTIWLVGRGLMFYSYYLLFSLQPTQRLTGSASGWKVFWRLGLLFVYDACRTDGLVFLLLDTVYYFLCLDIKYWNIKGINAVSRSDILAKWTCLVFDNLSSIYDKCVYARDP